MTCKSPKDKPGHNSSVQFSTQFESTTPFAYTTDACHSQTAFTPDVVTSHHLWLCNNGMTPDINMCKPRQFPGTNSNYRDMHYNMICLRVWMTVSREHADC